jgi:F-type H+-transporting ATPase subunit a
MPEQLWITRLLNHAFAGPVDGLLRALHLPPQYPQAPISNAVAMQVLVFVILVVVFALVRSSLSVDNPGPLQHIFEGVHGFINAQSEEIIGHHSSQYTPYLAALGYYILVSNLIGLVPGFESPTGVSPSVPLGCAILSFLYYHAQGFKHGGPGYLKHFAGPMPLLAPLMVPIEIISHLARVLSLTIRLYANMFAGDMVTLVFFSLVPLGIPVLFLTLHIGVSFLQTYIFVLLVTVYLQGAVATDH